MDYTHPPKEIDAEEAETTSKGKWWRVKAAREQVTMLVRRRRGGRKVEGEQKVVGEEKTGGEVEGRGVAKLDLQSTRSPAATFSDLRCVQIASPLVVVPR
jgi:hypothetical protein